MTDSLKLNTELDDDRESRNESVQSCLDAVMRIIEANMDKKYRVIVWDFSSGSPKIHLNKVVKNFEATQKIKSNFEKDQQYEVHFWEEKD